MRFSALQLVEAVSVMGFDMAVSKKWGQPAQGDDGPLMGEKKLHQLHDRRDEHDGQA